MKTPETNYEDLKEYLRENKELILGSGIPDQFFNLQKLRIKMRFAGKVFEEDHYKFEDFEGYKLFLRRIPFLEDSDVVEILEHEWEHANRAVKKGYKIQYGCWTFREGKEIGIQPHIILDGRNAQRRDLIEVVNAPKDKSESDLELLGILLDKKG